MAASVLEVNPGPEASALASACAADRPQIALKALLAEQHAVYDGLGASQAEAVRAMVLGKFSQCGLPDDAMPIVLAELETSTSASVLAGAAIALLAATALPPDGLDLLVRAARRLRRFDEVAAFAPSMTALGHLIGAMTAYGTSAQAHLAALRSEGGLSTKVEQQIGFALAKIASAQSEQSASTHCCASQAIHNVQALERPKASALDVEVEDQAGQRATFASLVAGRVAVIGFFYTRCMNPEKCSLTISKLAAVATALEIDKNCSPHLVAAITYDPAHDQATDLAAYGTARGFPFSSSSRLLRTVQAFEPLRDHFELGVGYGPSTVNQHRLDLIVIDAVGTIVLRHRHRLWDVDEVCTMARQAMGQA